MRRTVASVPSWNPITGPGPTVAKSIPSPAALAGATSAGPAAIRSAATVAASALEVLRTLISVDALSEVPPPQEEAERHERGQHAVRRQRHRLAPRGHLDPVAAAEVPPLGSNGRADLPLAEEPPAHRRGDLCELAPARGLRYCGSGLPFLP